MDQTVTLEMPSDEASELQAGIAQCLAEIEQIHEQMRRDQVDIEQSQARTRALLDEVLAQLRAA